MASTERFMPPPLGWTRDLKLWENKSAPRSEHYDTYCGGGFHPVELGQDINGYRIVRKLGTGSYATVWLARSVK
jgi:serine/threonine protein kinase